MTDNRTIADLRADLAVISHGFRTLGANYGGWIMPAFVLRNGIDCTSGRSLHTQYRRGMARQCFRNARTLVKRAKGLTYCEGYVLCPNIPIPLHHGWAVTDDREVVDSTLEDPERCAYLGVTFDAAAVLRWSMRGSTSLLLDGFETVNVDLIRSMCPDLLAGEAA
jgi:hypothetical protein